MLIWYNGTSTSIYFTLFILQFNYLYVHHIHDINKYYTSRSVEFRSGNEIMVSMVFTYVNMKKKKRKHMKKPNRKKIGRLAHRLQSATHILYISLTLSRNTRASLAPSLFPSLSPSHCFRFLVTAGGNGAIWSSRGSLTPNRCERSIGSCAPCGKLSLAARPRDGNFSIEFLVRGAAAILLFFSSLVSSRIGLSSHFLFSSSHWKCGSSMGSTDQE